LYNKKQISHKIYLILFLFTTIILLNPIASYSGGKKSPKEEGSIKFWHSIKAYNKEILNSIIDNYNQNSKGKKIVEVFQGNGEDLYLKLLSKENLPDVIQIPVQFIPQLKEKGLIIDLSSLISKKLIDDIPQKYWIPFKEAKDIYAVPFINDVNVIYVNRNVLRVSGIIKETYPDTWEDIKEIALKIKENTKDKWSIFIPMENIYQFVSFVQSYTGRSIFDNNRILVNKDEVIASMRFLQDLVYKYMVMPPKVTVDEGEQIFLSGNIGLMLASSSMLVYTLSNLPHDLVVWHMPKSKGMSPVISSFGLSIIKSSTKRENEAFRFIEYLTNYDNSLRLHTHTGIPPLRRSAKESLDLLVFYEENPNHIASVINLEKLDVLNPDIDYSNTNKIIKSALEEIMIDGKDPEKVLNSAQKEIDTHQ